MYFDKNGIVGQYKGKNVYVIDYEKYIDIKPQRDIIYAIRGTHRKGDRTMDLVSAGMLIGTMTDSGVVNLSRNVVAYEAKPQPLKPKTTSVAQDDPVALELDVSAGYGLYSKTVDEFFKGLDKLWAELEVG